jgi:16S rRNA (guanine527-N7)-methyltransferase
MEQAGEWGPLTGLRGTSPVDLKNVPAGALNEASAVIRELVDAGIRVPDDLAGYFGLYLVRIREWGRHINLVGPRDLDRIGVRHLLESFNVLQCPLDLGNGPLVDGGGFPGIPLALLLRDLQVLLVESVNKKARFLRRVTADLGLVHRVHIEAERVEALSSQEEFRNHFPIVTMRGLGPLTRVVPWCAPLLRPGGFLVAFKSTDSGKELQQAMGAIAEARLELIDIVPMRWGEGRMVILQRGD